MVHMAAAIPNLTYDLDTHYPWQSDEVLVGGRIVFEEGQIAVPREPGLGISLDHDILLRKSMRPGDGGLMRSRQNTRPVRRVRYRPRVFVGW